MDINQTQNKLNDFPVLDNNNKKTVINTLYKFFPNMSQFGYVLIDRNDQIDCLKSPEYYVTPHIIGVNCLLICITINNIEYVLVCNKKHIKPTINKVDIDNTHIFIIRKTTTRLFSPITLFFGRIYINNDGKFVFNILDMYINKGITQLNINHSVKIKNICEMLPELNNNSNNITILLAPSFDTNDIFDLVFNKIKNSDLKINGLIFIPNKTNQIFIYINDNEFRILRRNDEIEQVQKKSNTFNQPAIPLHMKTINQCDTDLKQKLLFKVTDITDVYELYKSSYEYNNIKDMYSQIIPSNKLGIAHIPDIKTSHYCKEKSNKNYVFEETCIYNKEFMQWMPLIE